MGKGLVFGPGSVTEGQLVALSSVGVVLLFLLAANLAVCWLYRRAASEDQCRSRRERQKKTERVWMYHMHRTTNVTTTNPESPAQQILRKLQTSHNNLRAKLRASASDHDDRQNSLRREEAQVLEELEVTTDLFLHDTSCASSRRSSLSAVSAAAGGVRSTSFVARDSDGGLVFRGAHSASEKPQPDSTSLRSDLQPVSHLDFDTTRDLDTTHDLETASTLSVNDAASALQEIDTAIAEHDLDISSSSYDLDVASALADLDMASALHDLDSAVSDTDRISMTSVTMADFENDDVPTDAQGKMPRKKRTRWSKRRSSGSHDNRGPHSLPVAEFHNEAFDFSERRTVVERVKGVEL